MPAQWYPDKKTVAFRNFRGRKVISSKLGVYQTENVKNNDDDNADAREHDDWGCVPSAFGGNGSTSSSSIHSFGGKQAAMRANWALEARGTGRREEEDCPGASKQQPSTAGR
jgi:hypothetical protein